MMEWFQSSSIISICYNEILNRDGYNCLFSLFIIFALLLSSTMITNLQPIKVQAKSHKNDLN